MKTIRVIHKRPSMLAEVVVIEDTLEALHALLDGGYLCVIRLSDGVHGYVDDEGLLKELPLNFLLRGEPIVGPAIFSKADAEGDEVGFETEEEASRVCARINHSVAMDPDEALKNAREALAELRAHQDADEAPDDATDNAFSRLAAIEELADAFEALDGWLSNGGFLPKDWQRP